MWQRLQINFWCWRLWNYRIKYWWIDCERKQDWLWHLSSQWVKWTKLSHYIERWKWIWHRRLGHMNFDDIVNISSRVLIWDMPKIKKPWSISYNPCHEGKKKRSKYPAKEYSTSKPLDLVHIDFFGPMWTESPQGDRYFMMLTDDYTRMTWITFMKENFVGNMSMMVHVWCMVLSLMSTHCRNAIFLV